MWKLKFKILKTKWKARVGEIQLNWVKLKTPVFMPVGTKATVKWLMLDLLKNQEYLWTKDRINLILSNTYHLFLRPGPDLIQQMWGLHKWENWDGLTLTDSGGFQVFSLWLWKECTWNECKFKSWESLVKLQENWVWFKSPKDWKKHFFTPENVVDFQMKFESDIMMMLDVCSPVGEISKQEVEKQMQLTHAWAKQAYDYFMPKYDQARWVLFPIVQWWLHKDLREQSAKYLSNFAQDWIAIWGLSVGETKWEMEDILSFTTDFLPEDKPRYLMWVGTPEDLIMWIREWIDMFDCVLPTRLGRHGTAFSSNWNIKLKNACHFSSNEPIDRNCNCYVCKNYSRSYLHHLVKENEMLAGTLISLHNIAYLHQLVEKEREFKI